MDDDDACCCAAIERIDRGKKSFSIYFSRPKNLFSKVEERIFAAEEEMVELCRDRVNNLSAAWFREIFKKSQVHFSHIAPKVHIAPYCVVL